MSREASPGGLAALAALLGAPGLIIAGVSLASFLFGLVLLVQEYDRPGRAGRDAVERLIERWARDTSLDDLGRTLRDYAAERIEARRSSREETARLALDSALVTLGSTADRPDDEPLSVVRVDSLELRDEAGALLAAWSTSGNAERRAANLRDVRLADPRGDRPAISLRVRYRVDEPLERVSTELGASYRRLLLAVAGLAGYSLLCLASMALQARAVRDRTARESARQATLDLADRTCHELGNVVFVLANERRNLADYLELVERHLTEGPEALALAAERVGLEPRQAERLAVALRRELARRGIDPATDLADGAALAREVCRQIEVCAEYIGMTVRELDGHLKQATQPIRLATVTVGECFDDALALLAPRLESAGARVDRPGLEAESLRVRADRRLVVHALVNLIKNAVEAAEGAGRPPAIGLGARHGANGRVELTIADDGPGLDPAVLGRVFEPGYSTKGPGRGRGLAITKESIEAQGGGLRVEALPGRGVVFVLSLCAT